MEILSKNSTLLFATFSPYSKNKRDPKNGNVEPFISFFSKKIKRLVILDQPHTGSDTVIPRVEEYVKGKLRRKYSLNNNFYKPFYWILRSIKLTDDDTNIFFKIRDILSVLHIGSSSNEKFQYFVGLESINTLAGIMLKKFGKISTVIYYVSDYSPLRYKNKFFNSIYLSLDRFCCYNADFIWDVSKSMQKGRILAGLDEKKSAPVIHVPNALFPKYIRHLDSKKIIPFSLVFMGSLGIENGLDLAIEAMPALIKKFPQIILHVIGGGEKDLIRVKQLSRSLNLDKNVKFYGIIQKDEDMLAVLRQFSIALAPYRNIEGSVRLYGDSLKLRAYMASGLPVITTRVPPLGQELEKFGSAMIAQDNKGDLVEAISDLLLNNEKLLRYRQRAILYAKSNTWDNSLDKAFSQMGKYSL